jgi:putative addiction module CopG family antidote
MPNKSLGSSTIRVALPRELASFVRDRVDSGLCTSASEVVREALRMLASQQSRSADGDALVDSMAQQEAAIDRAAAKKGMRTLKRLRRGSRLGAGLTTKDLVDDGRR